ncbi:heavy metal translocating P-type ATPase [Amycolatopsis decaplanina]|uniref:Heavy metal translocating P-type ATPase n=1 Tax=Amycolatopsis decaplanina DSM 44594 TaxID=1284240 RepID=M2Y0J6_9PSEU|nr:heavy metal translocating P-type ATPase [Amycolatopsis decaplanina]EME55050.1 heavy metal translocating P-type ATPase [Amycolatopsis decaplanina DSM 44594]
MTTPRWLPSVEVLLLIGVLTLLAAGGIARGVGPVPAAVLWAGATAVMFVPATLWVLADLRAGRWGADVLAVLALGGTVAVGEYLAGAIIAAMVATGRVLEAAARRRAGRDLSALLARAPTSAHVRRGDLVETVSAASVLPGDVVVVLPGEVVPVDGMVRGEGTFDESALTGEAEPVGHTGDAVRSGVVNAGAVVELLASATADASTYAGVVRLAEQAASATAPIARLADRVAVWFLPTALVIAALAWAFTADPVRAVAVLVTATPCPLLLAVPVAVTGGMSRMARSGVVVKDGAALELLGRVRTLAMDKTGTVTAGRPEITAVVCAPEDSAERVLGLAAAVEEFSPHVLAECVLRAARSAGVPLPRAEAVSETPGRGPEGMVNGKKIRVGRRSDGELPGWARGVERRGRLDLASVIWVEEDEKPVAALLVRDGLRPDAARTLRRLRSAGLTRIVLLTGDRVGNAEEVAAMLGLDDLHAECTPGDKISFVRGENENTVTAMVGDGVNDAPALAAASVGVALGSRGSTAAVQAADAVILDDRIDRLADAVEIARRARRLAVQSAGIGTGLSVLAMLAAAGGWLAPVLGALVQEGIDVAVIVNSLRAVVSPRSSRRRAPVGLVRRFAGEHETLLPVRSAVRLAADALAEGVGQDADDAVRQASRLLTERLLPHERAEEEQLYPALSEVLGDPDSTITMSREHTEIERLARRLRRHLDEAPDGIRADQVDDLRATLYGLDAILTLHFAQEEEAYFTL